MKRIVLMFALFFAVALIVTPNVQAVGPICGDGVVNQDSEVCDGADDAACPGECMEDCTCPDPPICGDGVVNQAWEECDPPDDSACKGECVECLCPEPPKCGDDMVNQPSEECDGTDDAACPGECTKDCTCPEPPGTCEPRTQGFWKRVCDGVYGPKRMHPETPENFSDSELCADLMVRGSARNLPCVRSASQIAALKLNSKYGMLDDNCKVYFDDMEKTVEEVLAEIDAMNVEDCKAAADLAEAINSGDALQNKVTLNSRE